MAEPGPRNLITDVPGLLVGQAQDEAGITGTTVVLCEAPAVAAVDVRGGAPGSRETELLDPAALVQRVDAIVLSGGSAFGLDAAGAVMEGLAAAGRGFAVRDVLVPIVAVNSWGSVVRPDCGRLWAADQALASEIEPQPALPAGPLDPDDFSACAAAASGANTTIAVVATNAPLDKSGCRRLAIMAQDGLAQAIRPAHTPLDGDTVFALAVSPAAEGGEVDPAMLARLGSAAASCLARAIMRAVMGAAPLGGLPSWRQLWGSAVD